MKTNKKMLVIVLIAAVLLVGLMLFLIFFPNGEDSAENDIDNGVSMSVSTDDNAVHQVKINTDKDGNIINNSYGTLMKYTPSDISTIHIENSSGTMDINSNTPKDSNGETSSTEYEIVGYEDFDLQAGKPDDVANDAASIYFSKVITLDSSKSSDYGFDSPQATVTVTYTDKTKAIIIVGDDAPQEAGTYIKFGSGNAVYLVEKDAVDTFSFGVTDMISLTINSAASDEDDGQASSITLSGSNFSDAIEMIPNTSANNSASYIIKKPSECYASESESSSVDGAIRGLYAESVKTVNPSSKQLESLGLSKPYAAVKAVYPDITVDLISSKPDGDGNVNIMQRGGKVVYVMASANLPWVTTSCDKLISEYVLNPEMTALSSMTVNDGKKTYEFKLSSRTSKTTDDSGKETTSTETTVKYGKNKIDESYFSIFFQNTSLIKRADFSDDSISGSPLLTVKYTYSSDNKSDTVSFYATQGSRYLAAVNGKTVGHVYKSDINRLINQAAIIAENKEVDSFAV